MTPMKIKKGYKNMKKTAIAAIAAAMLCGLCSCGNKVSVHDNGSSTAPTEASEVQTFAETESGQTTASGSSVTEKSTSTVSSATTTATSAGGNNTVSSEDAALISKAQELFTKACETSFNYSVGCPYSLDTNNYVENQYGWQFYLITDPNINSLADVRADYHKVFSENYPDNIEETYKEENGHAYCLNGARGSDIFYVRSEIVSVDSKSDNEIFFTVRNYYDGSSWGDEPYSEDKEFSAVVTADGSWRAGKFTLPY